MTDDLTQKVAEAIHGAALHGATAWLARDECDSAARAALDAIITQGGVTDEQIVEALDPLWDEYAEYEPDQAMMPSFGTFCRGRVRALMASAIATACAERDTEVEAMREAYASLQGVTAAANARAERAEAQVQRVRELIDEEPPSPGAEWHLYPADVRAVLDVEADR